MSVNEEESYEYDWEKEKERERTFNRQSLDILEEGTFHLLFLIFHGSSMATYNWFEWYFWIT